MAFQSEVLRGHKDHGVVRSAAAERGRARVEEAGRRIVLRAPAALRVVAEVVHHEVPCHRFVLGGEGMKRRHVVVLGQPFGLERSRVGASLEHENAHARLGETRRHRPAARSGADDDIVERPAPTGHRQKVLMNAISARLSSSLSGVSLPKAFSSSLRLSVLLNSSVPK